MDGWSSHQKITPRQEAARSRKRTKFETVWIACRGRPTFARRIQAWNKFNFNCFPELLWRLCYLSCLDSEAWNVLRKRNPSLNFGFPARLDSDSQNTCRATVPFCTGLKGTLFYIGTQYYEQFCAIIKLIFVKKNYYIFLLRSIFCTLLVSEN